MTAVGLVGKLPAHGDFVRRGGPAAVLTAIDRWLDGELGAAAAAGTAPDDAVADLAGWRFAWAGPDGATLASVIAGADRVGRCFPLVGTITGAGLTFAAAEAWGAAAAAALTDARETGLDADTALAALTVIDVADEAGPAVTGWWRAGDDAATGTAQLPTGAAFRALLGRGDA